MTQMSDYTLTKVMQFLTDCLTDFLGKSSNDMIIPNTVTKFPFHINLLPIITYV